MSVTSEFDQEPNPDTCHLPTKVTSRNLNEAWKYWANLTYMVGQFPSFDKYKYQILTWAEKDGMSIPADQKHQKEKWQSPITMDTSTKSFR